jgi:hypothetical protein
MRGASCFVRGHAGASVFVDQQFEVGTNFLIEVYLHIPR